MNLAEKVKQYMIDSRKNITTVAKEITTAAKEIKVGRSTLSKYLNGTYKSNPANIEAAITIFFENQNVQVPNEAVIAKEAHSFDRDKFFKSADASNVIAVAKACQDEKRLGCIIGTSGYGKSFTLTTYAKQDNVIYIECNSLMTRRDIITRIEEGAGLTVGRGTSDERIKTIVNFFKKHKDYLLIFDEADKLITRDSIEKLEILRIIFDLCVEKHNINAHTVGLLIAGEPSLKEKISNWDDRYKKRIGKFYKLEGLKREEVLSYLASLNMTQTALEELVFRATNKRSGCFRLLYYTLENIEKVLDGRTKITGEIIIEASSMMF